MKKYLTWVSLLSGLYFTAFISCAKEPWLDYYSIETITVPDFIDPQVGGITVLQNGDLAATFHSGQVAIRDKRTTEWHVFASGLHEPLGIIEDKDGALVVAQQAELTRLVDEDNDGIADLYQTLSDAFGMSGNYHEFLFGPTIDQQGNYYVSLNLASHYAGIFEHVRGKVNPIGLSQKALASWRETNWKDIKHQAGRMFSKVPYRGWVLKVTPEGETVPYASGFRSPNGLLIDNKNRLWVTDNQGDWLGTSPLYHVELGKFYGHPASLVWQQGWHEDPVNMTAEQLNAIRSPAAAKFPQGELANSPTQPILSSALFGLPKGELLIGEMNQKTLVRFLPDEVNGVMQGTLIPFLQTESLGMGNNRMSFDEKGQLWLGKTHLGWAGGEGIRRIRWHKKPLFLVDQVSQVQGGFAIHFSQPLAEQAINLVVTSHSYHYHAKYGSEKVNEKTLEVKGLALDSTRQLVTVTVPELQQNYLYTFTFQALKDVSGRPLMGDVLRYNLVKSKSR